MNSAIGTLRILFMTTAVSFAAAALIAPRFIPVLRRLKFGQEVRDDGPESHLKKKGTPTMGGVIILASVLLSSFIGLAASGQIYESALQVLFLTLAFGLTGFADDFLKIKRHNSDGLRPYQKMALQLAAAVIFSVWAYYRPEALSGAGRVYIPFTGHGAGAASITMPAWLFVPFSVFVIIGTDNGVNFTDGLDGLCSSVTSVVAAFFIAAGLLISGGVSVVSAAMLGALLGFLIFNSYPAKVFMGDTGSLSLGGFVAACAVITGAELYVVIVGFVYLAEVLSVMIQVAYFKRTGGKRFFKMAPIHHHFELCGSSETRIVCAFTVITLLLSGLAAIGFFYAR